ARRILPVETGQDAGAARDALIDTTVPAPDDDLLRELDRRAGKKIFRYVTRLVARLCVLTGAQARDYAELLCKGGSKGLAKVDDALDFLLEGRFLREVFLDRGGSAPALLAGKPFLDRMHSEADAMQQALLSPFPQEESLSGMIAPRSVRRALACNDSELRYLKGVRSHEKKKGLPHKPWLWFGEA
ncbi:MAG: hypothetical protein Q4F72_12805, partial [Desulfovibrionaceae bacterium]|nr:hypothetical protein [Desulfovibrionaceae bacterium]